MTLTFQKNNINKNNVMINGVGLIHNLARGYGVMSSPVYGYM